ncbi:MAG: carbohydrate binding domain-containing protein [Chitinispirillaceae bacterium]|nr:carbohydrate binding domain-containing protein [Chitinispirillaceae bacterium]
MYKVSSLLLVTIFFASTLFSQENLIRNGNFTDSTGAHWSLESNGAHATGAVSMGKYLISIESQGAGQSSPQLVQRNLELAANEGYLLSFKVSASDSGAISVLVGGDNNLLFTDSANAIVSVGTSVKTYSTSFFVSKQTGNGRIMFNCGVSKNLTRISIDSIVLVKDPKPIIRVIQPDADTRWIAGTEREIEWQNSGILNKIKISFSSDKGATWNAITPEATNQKSFWWHIPATISGNECLIIVSDSSGTVADTTEPFKIVTQGTIDIKEMVKNGAFLDSTDWRLSTNAPARANGRYINDEYVISVDTAGTAAWQVKLEQPGFTLENGTMYRFSYDAYATHNRQIFANVGADNGNPAWSVYGGDTAGVNITTVKTKYSHTIIMKYPTSGNIRIEFNCGNDTGKVFIDNVSLIKLENANVFIFNPSMGSILKSGSKFNIEWHAKDVSTIDLEFSSDNMVSWTKIFDKIDNLGVVSWLVPDSSSEKCFIRIRNAANDSIIGSSSQFVINAFGTPVKTGELVVNGSFTNNLQGWKTSFNNSQGQTSASDQLFKLSVSQPGTDYSSIILSQSDIPVLKDKEYTFSFDTYANGTRSMKIKVVLENDSVAAVDTLIDLPSVSRRLEYKFTAPRDAIARIEFLLGGSRASVFLDNISFYTGELPLHTTTAPRFVHAKERFSAFSSGAGMITFKNCNAANGTIAIYSLKGELIQKLASDVKQLRWNGRTISGKHAISGTYIAVFTAPKMQQSCRFLLK